MNGSKEVAGSFVVACSDGAVLPEACEEVFNPLR